MGTHLKEEDLGEPVLEIVMEQGDALYVPRGFIHVADTFEDTGSLHLTVRGTNSFFFNMGHLFNAALAKDGEAKAVPRSYSGSQRSTNCKSTSWISEEAHL